MSPANILAKQCCSVIILYRHECDSFILCVMQDTGAGGGGGGYDSLGAGSDDNTGVWTYPPDSSGRQPFPAYTSSGLGATSAAAAALKQPQDRYIHPFGK